mmetsp:Transcript_14076/g.37876  ORF Transcript_14076/g.37876 Transcript_14076/m.37876 type:complete len:219 (-) Transcript_14076:798-1454(-)
MMIIMPPAATLPEPASAQSARSQPEASALADDPEPEDGEGVDGRREEGLRELILYHLGQASEETARERHDEGHGGLHGEDLYGLSLCQPADAVVHESFGVDEHFKREREDEHQRHKPSHDDHVGGPGSGQAPARGLGEPELGAFELLSLDVRVRLHRLHHARLTGGTRARAAPRERTHDAHGGLALDRCVQRAHARLRVHCWGGGGGSLGAHVGALGR